MLSTYWVQGSAYNRHNLNLFPFHNSLLYLIYFILHMGKKIASWRDALTYLVLCLMKKESSLTSIQSYPKDQDINNYNLYHIAISFCFDLPPTPQEIWISSRVKTDFTHHFMVMLQIPHPQDYRSFLHQSIHLFTHLLNYPTLSEHLLLTLIWLWLGDLLRAQSADVPVWVAGRVTKEININMCFSLVQATT